MNPLQCAHRIARGTRLGHPTAQLYSERFQPTRPMRRSGIDNLFNVAYRIKALSPIARGYLRLIQGRVHYLVWTRILLTYVDIFNVPY